MLEIPIQPSQEELDKYCIDRAKEAIKLSTCNKKQLGCALLTRDNKLISGFNGPPSPYIDECDPCPRLKSHNGTDLHLCKAVHAERYVLLRCADIGISTTGSTLYSYMGVPCKDCMLELITAGVSEIVCIRETYYDELSKEILKEWIDKGGIFRIYDRPDR